MKTINTLLTIAFALLFCSANGQLPAPGIEWQNTIGGDSSDFSYTMQLTSDGGCIVGGASISGVSGDKTEASLGDYDYWVVKLNSAGALEWQNTIGGSDYDYLQSIQQTLDGGYILGGWSKSGISGDKTEISSGIDYWVVKLNSTGTLEWQNTIGGSNFDFLYSIQQTSDGGYLLGGESYSGISGDKTEASLGGSDYWVVKLNSIGAIEWQNTIGGNDDEGVFCIQQTSDGGYILGGSSLSGISGDKTEASLGDYDYWIVKLNNAGAIEWQNTIGGSGSELFNVIQQTSNGGYVIGGTSMSGISGDKTEASAGFADYWVLKLSSIGAIEWQNTIGGNNEDLLYSLQQTIDNGYIISGASYSGISGDKTEANLGESYTSDYWVVKLSTSGVIEWENTIGGSGSEGFNPIHQTPEGGYLIGGASSSGISGDKTEASLGSSDYWVVKLYPEICNSITVFADGDGDSYGDLSTSYFVEDCIVPGGYVSDSTDCNDSNASVHPNSTEVCNSIDDNCDGVIDENCGGNCGFPFFLTISNITTSSAKTNWNVVGEAQRYKMRYKVTGSTNWTTITNISSPSKKVLGLLPGTSYTWQVKSVCSASPIVSSDWSSKQTFTTLSERIGDESLQHVSFSIYPNPAEDYTAIHFTFAKSTHVYVKVYDLTGREIETLLNDELQKGDHSLQLNTAHFSKGVYIVKLISDFGIENQKLIVQ